MSAKQKLKKFINEFELYLGALLFIAITILLTMQAVSRYVFNHSYTWTEEISVIFFIWMTYLGASAAVLKGKHLRIDLILNMLKGNVKKAVLILTNVITIAFCVYMIFPLMRLVELLTKSGAKTILTGLRKDLVYMVLPVSLALTAIRLIQDSIRIVKQTNDDVATNNNKTIFEESDLSKKEEKKGSDTI